MSIESAIEKIIQKGMAEGQFDNLKGSGEPLDLTDYFNTPEDLRMAYSLLKSNQFVPEEVDLIKEIAALKLDLARVTDPQERETLSRRLHDRSLALTIAMERRRRR